MATMASEPEVGAAEDLLTRRWSAGAQVVALLLDHREVPDDGVTGSSGDTGTFPRCVLALILDASPSEVRDVLRRTSVVEAPRPSRASPAFAGVPRREAREDADDRIGSRAVPCIHDIVEPLTARETEVLEHLAELLTTEEIAAQLFVSVNTVRTHVRSILRKLAVTRRNQAVRRARALHLIDR